MRYRKLSDSVAPVVEAINNMSIRKRSKSVYALIKNGKITSEQFSQILREVEFYDPEEMREG
jgi:hypothetical protein